MFSIIICDANQEQREELQHYLEDVCKELEILSKFIHFETGEQLLNSYTLDIDLVVLDIHLQGMDGMQTARRLREVDGDVDIIFISESRSYMQEGYEVGAKRYLTRPIHKDDLKKQIKQCIKEKLMKKEEYIWIKSGYSAYKIPVHNILYAETYGRKVNIHTKNKMYDTHISLAEIEGLINEKQFFRCHRGYLINLQYVEGIEKEHVIIKEERIPISRFKIKPLKQMLLELKDAI